MSGTAHSRVDSQGVVPVVPADALAAERESLMARIKAMPRRTEQRRELEARVRDLTRALLEREVAAAAEADAEGAELKWFQK